MRSFRFTCSEAQIPEVEALLRAEGLEFEPEPFSPLCRRLVFEPIAAGSSLAAFFGYIYIQDRSSMLPPLALAPPPQASVLDMCASPGSKTGLLAQLTGENGFVLANEPNSARLMTLQGNLRLANCLHTAICAYHGEKLPLQPESWDYILLDPPCSGWGTEAKNPQVKKIWRGQKINALLALQKQLLIKANELLAPGGLLLYSTCTTNHRENQEQTTFACAELGLEKIPLPDFPGFVFEPLQDGSLLVDGAASAAQGFYLALLRKPAGPSRAMEGAAPKDYIEIERGLLTNDIFDPALLPPGKIALFGDKALFLPDQALNLAPGLKWNGFPLGIFKGNKFRPASRLKKTLPKNAACIQVDKTQDLKKLISGQTLLGPAHLDSASLWWRSLPLASITLKNGRMTAIK